MKAKPVTCPACGLSADEWPGFRLDEFPTLDAVFVGDESVPPPQRLICLRCNHIQAVARDSIEVRRPR